MQEVHVKTQVRQHICVLFTLSKKKGQLLLRCLYWKQIYVYYQYFTEIKWCIRTKLTMFLFYTHLYISHSRFWAVYFEAHC